MTVRSTSTGLLAIGMLLLIGGIAAAAERRFPPPDFTSHELPTTQWHPARDAWQDLMDVAVLANALFFAAWIVHYRRSRRWMFGLTVFSLGYFGFYRFGCVCPIGAIGNVTLALSDPTYAIPVVVVFFFALPLVFAFFFGRVFCSGVCPLGAVQDLVLIRRVKVPEGLDGTLRVVPFVYLGLAVLLAATGTMLIICRYDPFVSLFRMAGVFSMLAFAAGALVISMFIGRPYCRWVCPYGAILGCIAQVSWTKVSTTPDECIVCRLCENVCPYGAIRKPTLEPEEDVEETS